MRPADDGPDSAGTTPPEPSESPDHQPADPQPARQLSTKRSSTLIALASASAAASAFVIQWAVGRFSAPEVTAEFLVYWALLFAAFGVIGGIRHEITRSVGTTRTGSGAAEATTGPRALVAALLVGTVGGVILAASAPAWAGELVPSTAPAIVPVVALSVLMYTCHVTILGSLAGRESWQDFSVLMIVEAAVRVALVGAVLLVGGGLMPLELAVAVTALSWLGMMALSAETRRAAAARTDVGLGRLLRNSSYTVASSVASSALITGFPVLMQFTSRDADAAVLAGTILAIALTRAPLMIPLQAFQGYAIMAFLRSEGSRLLALVRPLAIIGGLGVVAAIAAWLLGPWIMDLLFADRFDVEAHVFAGLMIAAAALAMLTLSGTAALADNAHVGYTAGWTVSAVVAFALLLLPLSLPDRSVIALIAGPVVGLVVHLAAITGRARTP